MSQQMIESRINEIKNNLPPNTDITVEKDESFHSACDELCA